MEKETEKFELMCIETIKPSSPTPSHRRSFTLSRLDQFNPSFHVPMVMFYASSSSSSSSSSYSGSGSCGDENENENDTTKRISQRLKDSLSQVLTLFYPIAGRIKDHLSVDCNDEGVHFAEVQCNIPLSDVLQQPTMEALRDFMSFARSTVVTTTSPPLLLVQASFFGCGGIALGIMISHKIADATALSTFIKAWACTALGSPNAVVPELGAAASLFPPIDPFPESPLPSTGGRWRAVGVARRFVFEASKISVLKAKAASTITSIQNPTRVEVVSALIWKCAVKASKLMGSHSHSHSQRASASASASASALGGSVNMRASLVPPLSPCSFGNICGSLNVQVANESEIDYLPSIVHRFREAVSECRNQRLEENKSTVLFKADEVTSFYRSVCWCRMPFYEADFGWGKPIWVTNSMAMLPNTIVLMDTRDGGGIEAWVKLIDEEMALFESDPELLEFAKLNPSAL